MACTVYSWSHQDQHCLVLVPQISYTDLWSPVRCSPSDSIGKGVTHSAVPYSSLTGFMSKLSHGFPLAKGVNNYFILSKSDIFPFQEEPLLTWQGAKLPYPTYACFLPYSCVCSYCSVHISRYLRSAEGYSSIAKPRGVAFLLLL